MSRRRGKDYENVDYSKLAGSDSGFTDAQFAEPPTVVPWKSVALAASLCLAGTVLLVLGVMVVSGSIDVKYSDRMWPMIILGILMFIPGAYHIRIAYYAYRKVPGYSFDDIPEFD